MKKIILATVAIFFICYLQAQDTTLTTTSIASQAIETPKPNIKTKYNLSNRPNDHFMVQLGYTNWAGKMDTIQTKGFNRSINVYFMYDFPFKATPKISAAAGLGIGTDNIMFKKTTAEISERTSTLRFNNPLDSIYKKSKLVTAYLELPIELRYSSDPEHSDKSFKFALGVKVGTMLNAHTRSRTTANSYLTDHIVKQSSKNFFNTTRAVGTVRIGYGVASLFGNFQFTSLLKNGVGPVLHPYTVGLTLSGL
jgi:hypothetical protein